MVLTESLKIDKPIRLIELFAGIGSQAKALERCNVNFEHYKISEWEVNATASYKAIHKEYDNTDYSAEFTAEQLTEILFNVGISADGKKPLTLKEIARKGEPWKRTVYNNFKATNNIGSILNVQGADLGIVDTDKYCYMMTYSFPCQDLSLAGKCMGMAKGDNTRSGLLWEVERLLNECNELPQILLMENVTQVHGKKNVEHFNEWISFLESKGYSNYWEDLNAKNFGIPQNRNRTFMVSVLNNYRYEFPKEFPLELRLKDMLEDNVDEKFYLSNKMLEYAFNIKKEAKGIGFSDGVDRSYLNPDIAQTIGCRSATDQRSGTTNYVSDDRNKIRVQDLKKIVNPAIEVIGNYSPSNYDASRVVSVEGIAPTVKENHGMITAVAEPCIIEDFYKNRDERVYEGVAPTLRADRNGLKVAEPLAYDEQNGYIREDGTVGTLTTDGSSPKHNNRVIEPQIKQIGKINSSQDGVIVDSNGISPTHTAGHGNSPKIADNMRIRKLTPKECWRLMGFDDADFEKASKVNSNSQLYKQAGNSIVVNVLEEIFKKML